MVHDRDVREVDVDSSSPLRSDPNPLSWLSLPSKGRLEDGFFGN